MVRINRKLLLVGVCCALIGGAALVDVSVPLAQASSVTQSITAGLKKAGEVAKQKATAMANKLKAFAKSVAAGIKQLAVSFNKTTYNDRYITMTVPLAIGEKTYTFGFEYDFGFMGGGDIEKGFPPLIAWFWPPIVIEGVPFGLTGDQFIQVVRSLTKLLKDLTKPIPVFPTKAVVSLVDNATNALSKVTRFKPETVFFLKLYFLARSAGKTVNKAIVPIELTTLLVRLANSDNEFAIDQAATMKRNPGITDVQNAKSKVYYKYKDTGIEAIFNKIPKSLRSAFDGMKKLKVTQGAYQEWLDRKAQKAPTPMQLAYSNMRRIPEYNDKSLYALGSLIPLLDQGNLNYADQELFVKAMRIHAARRFEKMFAILKVKLDAADAQEATAKTGKLKIVEEATESVDNVNNELALVKEMIKDRFPGLIKVLEEAMAKMQAKGFSQAHISAVANILAKVRADEQKLIPLCKRIVVQATTPEAKAMEDIAGINDMSAFDPLQSAAPEQIDLTLPDNAAIDFGAPVAAPAA